MKSRLNPMETAGALMVLSLIAVAILAPWLAPYDPTRAVANTFGDPAPPSRMFPLGWHRMIAARQRHSERSEESRSDTGTIASMKPSASSPNQRHSRSRTSALDSAAPSLPANVILSAAKNPNLQAALSAAPRGRSTKPFA